MFAVALDPPLHRAGRQPDRFTKRIEGEIGILLQQFEQALVDWDLLA